MKKLLPYVLAVHAALAAAILLWALQEKFPGPLTNTLSPVWNSPWEMGKAAFFPLLAAAPTLWVLQKGGSRNYYVMQMNEQISDDCTRYSPERQGYWDEDQTEELDDMELAVDEYCAAFKAQAIVKGFTDADWDNYCKELDSKLHVKEYVELFNEYLSRNEK